MSYVIGFNASSNESLNRDTPQRGKRLSRELIKKKNFSPTQYLAAISWSFMETILNVYEEPVMNYF